ncbi:VCBS repeat-containing protein [Cohnella endophytica]|uniref:VCBS repeat-containing protein n=1 Tax=Cohnella endophytica TaxID=2419778 RepID=A0A494XAN4_9BACL|nr:VCBS repeat-containing protein [Cohnella endophytica]RKP47877.1 VCBS repeat-containing protein [Cohnella endophytica]
MFNLYRQFQEFTQGTYTHSRSITLLDMKQGDVNGDGIIDNVYLYGNKPDGIFADNITLLIQDGHSNQSTTVNLQNNAGYHPTLFLGDFSKDNVKDILVSIDTGGSGGYGIFYIYSFKNNILYEMFDVEKYNKEYKFNVNYEDFYKVSVGSPQLDVLFTIDISYKGYDYLSQYYYENGKLKQPIKGEVLALGALYPIVTNERMGYDLLAFQRIIGTSNSDTLGYVENLLTWNGTQFTSSRLSVSILGTKLISLF